MLRFLLDPLDAVSVEFRDTEALGVFHLFEQDARASALRPEIIRRPPNIFLDDIVAQYHADGLPGGKVLAKPQSFGDTAFSLLIRIGDVFQAEMFAIGKQAQKI